MSKDLQARPYTGWQLIRAYWQSDQRFFAYIMLSGVFLFTILLVALNVVFNYWFNYFYDALQAYDKRSVLDLLVVFVFIATVLIILAVYRYYVQQMLGLRWRRWLTKQFLTRWLANKSYYYLESFDQQTDNPDQRIQEDISGLVSQTLSLAIGFLSSICTFFAFIFVLWTLSGSITIPLGPLGSFKIHGYLVWAAVTYAIVGTLLTFRIGQPLISLNFEQQRREANFRFAAIDLRNHSEHVALYHGESHQKGTLTTIFERALDNWYLIILRQKLLLWFTAGYNQVSVLLPLVVALPNYFSRVFRLGGLIQTLQAFNQIQDALSFLVNSYTSIAEWRAIKRRLITFLARVYEVEHDAELRNKFIMKHQPGEGIRIENVSIDTPRGDALLKDINLNFSHGKQYLLKGVSGLGKSTLVRVIAGIWPFGGGTIYLPEKKKIMYLPQKTYMPLGTLKEALLFPDEKKVSDAEVLAVLRECGLEGFVKRMNNVEAWSQIMSPGEQQRVAFARVLIQEPDWVFLDETTSALDIKTEAHMYQILKARLPNCSIISVGHRPSLEELHDEVVDLTQYQ